MSAVPVAGLGNPGERYRQTRHNAGFWVVEALAERTGAKWESGFGCEFAKARVRDVPVILIKPMQYMNVSGEPIRELISYYRLEASALVVVHDEVDLLLGALKLKRGGSSGGHNGVESIAQHLGTPDFVRVRVGVGRPSDGRDAADWVLGKPSKDEREILNATTLYAADAVETVVGEGLDAAVKGYNRRAFRSE